MRRCAPGSLRSAHTANEPDALEEDYRMGRRQVLRFGAAAAILGCGAVGAVAETGKSTGTAVASEADAADIKERGFARELFDGMLAGAVAGAAVDLALFPLDTVGS